MCISKNYIALNYTAPSKGIEEKWFISYKGDGDYFTCENNIDKKITKLKKVENFIEIWINSKNTETKYQPWSSEGSICIFINDKLYSGYTITRTTSISLILIQNYISLLKDVIEENDDKPVRQVDKAVGGYDIIGQGDKNEVFGELVGDYDIT